MKLRDKWDLFVLCDEWLLVTYGHEKHIVSILHLHIDL